MASSPARFAENLAERSSKVLGFNLVEVVEGAVEDLGASDQDPAQKRRFLEGCALCLVGLVNSLLNPFALVFDPVHSLLHVFLALFGILICVLETPRLLSKRLRKQGILRFLPDVGGLIEEYARFLTFPLARACVYGFLGSVAFSQPGLLNKGVGV